MLDGYGPTVTYDVEFVGGVKNTLFGGEGLFLATVTVLVQFGYKVCLSPIGRTHVAIGKSSRRQRRGFAPQRTRSRRHPHGRPRVNIGLPEFWVPLAFASARPVDRFSSGSDLASCCWEGAK